MTTTQYRVGLEFREIEILSEPFVMYTSFGYAPVITIRVANAKLDHHLFISAKTLSHLKFGIQSRRSSGNPPSARSNLF